MLILEPCAGLSNRILAIATAYRLACDTRQKLELLWDIDGAVGVRLQELFTLPQDIKIRTMTKLPYRKRPFLRAKSDLYRFVLRKKADTFLDCGDTERMRQSGSGREQLQELLCSQELVYIKAFCELTQITDKSIFAIFMPSEEILRKGKEVFESVNRQSVGFHIRRTDHEEAIRRSPLSLFYDKINEILKTEEDSRIFLATDDKNVENKLLAEFPGRVICYQGKRFGRDDKAGMQDGLIDLLALSRCREIYGSYGSTFSRMAAYLGGCELTILQEEVSFDAKASVE